MHRLTAEPVVDDAAAAAILAPRRGLVLEAVDDRAGALDGRAGDGTSACFSQSEGPWPTTGARSKLRRWEGAGTRPAK